MKIYTSLLSFFCLAVLSVQALAVTVNYSNNTASFNIHAQMDVPIETGISGLQDVHFMQPDTTLTSRPSACIYTNAPSGEYQITFKPHVSSGSSYSRLTLNGDSSSGAKFLDYTMNFYPYIGKGEHKSQTINPNTTYGPYNTISTGPQCSESEKVQFAIQLVTNTASEPPSPGEYISYLTIQVDAV